MNRFVIAEASKCIGCRTCEIACALAHPVAPDSGALTTKNFAPRLTLVRSGSVTTPVMCRQCDDAPCVRACPSGAIVYSEDSVQVVQSRCVGCKTCVVACPYGVMSVVSVPSAPQPGATLGTQKMKSEAQKCDLCITRTEGPACIPVCPTKALHLVDKEMMASALRRRKEQAARDLANSALF
ncbi:4Fe-4S dicluster domain-containing protein [Niveibacterium umoris]|uniref:Electron transport protein HydN n=1 Tax=Niveibacterium umoris TaxID=1193620 RepID=A0A840BGI4_9RHOO|nr:4Fe-4S dicluster domain-containing protein [Niveibacterium umoris]MBB4012661.1 electron transport protein HydN [Niveibacterium umoris]